MSTGSQAAGAGESKWRFATDISLCLSYDFKLLSYASV